MPGDGRRVQVAKALILVPDVSLLLEHPQLRPHGRVTRGTGDLRQDLAGGGAAQAIEGVHDLSLPLREACMHGRWRHAILITPVRNN